MLIIALALLAISATDTATADSTSTTPPAAEAKPAAKPDRICRKETVIGSALPKKVCYSRSEAERIRAEDQQALRQRQSSPLSAPR